jgi:hypothetical protein
VIVKHRLYERLAVVERALDRNRVDAVFGGCRHHAALHVRDAPIGEQDHHVSARRRPEGLDSRAARISRSRADDGGALVPLRKNVIHEARQELHGDVLESERRPVEQLQNERAVIDLH